MCQRALTQNANTGGGGALKLLELRLLEDGGERGGDVVARGSVAVETAGEDGERAALSRGADRTLRGRLAYLSTCSVELPLSPSARAAPPLEPMRLKLRLQAQETKLVLSVSGR